MTKTKLTPMFEQYLQIKQDYPDALLFYRMGDFYELFFEDAEIAARELQIALTCRNPNAEVRIPMCGVPHHAADNYLSQLLSKGHKVAVCDQVENPKEAKGLVKRAVTRVLTPGTVVEDSNLKAKSPNYLAALYWDSTRGVGGLSWVDFSTGSFQGLHGRREKELWQWAIKIDPRELILPRDKIIPAKTGEIRSQITRLPETPDFDLRRATNELKSIQSLETLETIDLHDKPELVRACGAILSYLRQTQKQDMTHLAEFKLVNLSKYLLIDEVTERNLEIFRRLDGGTGKGTLWHSIDQTMTPMGGRLLQSRLRRPWRDASPIEKSLNAVEKLYQNDEFRSSLRHELDTVYDMERLSTRIVLGRAMPKDFIALRRSMQALPGIREILSSEDELPTGLKQLSRNWDNMGDLCGLLEKALVDSPPTVITDGGLFRTGYNDDLDHLISLTEHGQAALNSMLEEERSKSGIPKLKLGFNKVFGYYFEVSKSVKDQVPNHFIRRQTLVNSERYITEQLKAMEDRILSASDERKELEYKLFQEVRDILAAARDRFTYMAQSLAALDFWQGLAESARINNWTRPELDTGITLNITEGRHPVVEDAIGANYIPNSIDVDDKRRILLITGPNMAGKSTVLRQVALIAIMAQIGSFVPASKAVVGLADRVFSRVGASDNLAQGQSTFMVEMMETARILRMATSRSLVILDEIGRGTSTFDGLALAWAVVEELSKRGRGGIRTLFATHYHELTSLEGHVDGLRNLNIAVKEWQGDIVFLRRLVPGPADKSYGVEVARLAGVPRPVVERARELLANLEKKSQTAKSFNTGPRQSALPGLGEISASTGSDSGSVEEHPLMDEIRNLDPDMLTPLEALTTINRWKQILSSGTVPETE